MQNKNHSQTLGMIDRDRSEVELSGEGFLEAIFRQRIFVGTAVSFIQGKFKTLVLRAVIGLFEWRTDYAHYKTTKTDFKILWVIYALQF